MKVLRVKRNKKENGEVYGRMMYGYDNVNGKMIENKEEKRTIGSLIMNILSSINEFEVEVIRERIKDVKRNKKENGEVYGRMMYGYDNVNGKS